MSSNKLLTTMFQMLRQMIYIVVLGALLGFALNVARPQGVALLTPIYPLADSGTGSCTAEYEASPINAAEAASRCNDCTVAFVDARGAADYAGGHIAGAQHLPPYQHPDSESAIADLLQRSMVVVYGDNSRCKIARQVAQRLIVAGHQDVRVLEGGWSAWSSMSHPAASGACQKCEHSHQPEPAHD